MLAGCSTSSKTSGERFLDATTTTESTYKADVSAYVGCQQFVERRLKSPGSAKYPAMTSDAVKITRGPNGRRTFDSYVDSENGFGALLRSTYLCTVEPGANPDEWHEIAVTVLER